MPALKQVSFRKFARSLLFLLVTIVFLTSTAVVEAQGQTTEPWQKRQPSSGEKSTVPGAEGLQPLTTPNLVRDPSLELSYSSGAYWSQGSYQGIPVLCTTADCGNGGGTAGPRTGSVWAWFGGLPFYDAASLSQIIQFPACSARLQFYFWIGAAGPGSSSYDTFTVKIDNQTVFSANATQRSLYPSYRLVSLDVSGFANANYRELRFESVTNGGVVTFNLDDVSLTGTCMTISGNTLVNGVQLTYPGGAATSDINGDYRFNVPYGWSGTVTPSKAGYRFSPASRPYTNVTQHLVNQDYTAIPLHTISGNAGVGGVTLSFTEGTPRTVTSQPNGDYSLIVPNGWYGTVTPSHPCFTFTPANPYYPGVYSDQANQDYTPVPNVAAGCSDINVEIGGANQGKFALGPGASTRASFTSINNGPVKIVNADSTSLIAAERLIYKVSGVATSFSEMMGLPDGQLDNTYWLPWYNNVDLDTQLRIGNVSGSTATVHIFIGPNEVTPLEGITLPAGGSTRVSYAGINNGPVKIVSNQNIVAAERLIYKVNGVATSFSEMMALPNSQLDNTYWLPWYNNVDLDTQLRFANVHDTETAEVHVLIDGVEMPNSPFPLLPGESTRKSFAGINNGPVQIVSNVPIVAAERLIYKVNGVATSFSEMMALPNSKLDMTYWLPWYNNVDLDTQLRFANVHETETAQVHVLIGGVEVPNSPFPLLPGESTRRSFAGINSGPVHIVSNVPIVAAERLIYKVGGVNTSFSEMMALPASQLDTLYWLPWYNNVDLDTQLRFGVP